MAEIDKPLPNVDIKDEAFVETEVETPIEENLSLIHISEPTRPY